MNPPRIVYLAHDLSDAAIARRVQMLRWGGAEVKLAGFRRTQKPITAVEGIAAIDLGQSFDGRLFQRAALVARRGLTSKVLRGLLDGADVVLARNLEMVSLAEAAGRWAGQSVRMIYECLDIHRSVLGKRLPNRLLRRLDARAVRRVDALIISSSAFLEQYFSQLVMTLPPVILAENKRIPRIGEQRPTGSELPAGPPWQIGWFGILRCVRSFQLLRDLAQSRPGRIEVVMRGRPTDAVRALIEAKPPPNMRYDGPYMASELSVLYASCHFTWALDYSDEGLNSDWLLPNRLYEGGFYNVPALARAGTATASWLQARDAGVIFDDLLPELMLFLDTLTPERMHNLRQATAEIPTSDLVWTAQDCRDLVRQISQCPG